jgi:hypothetical protein
MDRWVYFHPQAGVVLMMDGATQHVRGRLRMLVREAATLREHRQRLRRKCAAGAYEKEESHGSQATTAAGQGPLGLCL